MNFPFTSEQFFEVFIRYNTSVWPAQVLLYIAAAILVYSIFRPYRFSNKVISGILGVLWLWMGIVYHITFFSSINPAANLFGGFFIAQGLIFLIAGAYKEKLEFKFVNSWSGRIGSILILLGTIVYPIISYLSGHIYPNTPTFGLPCPTTIFTFGVLLLSIKPPRYLVLIPFIWSIIGFTAAFAFGVKEDCLLLISGIIATLLILAQSKKYHSSL